MFPSVECSDDVVLPWYRRAWRSCSIPSLSGEELDGLVDVMGDGAGVCVVDLILGNLISDESGLDTGASGTGGVAGLNLIANESGLDFGAIGLDSCMDNLRPVVNGRLGGDVPNIGVHLSLS